jgi:hypothetical protein
MSLPALLRRILRHRLPRRAEGRTGKLARVSLRIFYPNLNGAAQRIRSRSPLRND